METNNSRDKMVARMALAAYTGERCKFCGFAFKTVEDLLERKVVYAGYHEHGRTACGSCWEKRHNKK